MIFDTADKRILAANVSVRSTLPATHTIKIECVAGYQLSGSTVADCTVEAKESTDVSWTAIESTPYDLTPFDGLTKTFLVRFTAPTIAARKRRAFSLTVSKA